MKNKSERIKVCQSPVEEKTHLGDQNAKVKGEVVTQTGRCSHPPQLAAKLPGLNLTYHTCYSCAPSCFSHTKRDY